MSDPARTAQAYGLHGTGYGRAAIDTIVSKVHNAPGDDIAVLLLGYESEMKVKAGPGELATPAGGLSLLRWP